MNLVVVDDDGDVRKALARLLRCLGHQVQVFASADAFESESVSPDCAIIDIRMPGQSGLHLCEKLRSLELPVPVVLISGEPGARHGMSGVLGNTPSISKPFDHGTLVDAITDAISGRPRQQHGAY